MDGGRQDGIFVVLDADQKTAEVWSNCQGNDGDHDESEAEPEKEGVPLPGPELAGESDGIGAGGMNKSSGREGNGSGMEDDIAEADEGNDEQKLQRVYEVIG